MKLIKIIATLSFFIFYSKFSYANESNKNSNTNNKILDPSRIGSRFFSKKPYTISEILDRSFILGSTGTSIYYGLKKKYLPKKIAILGMGCFILSHTIVTTPLILKRLEKNY